MNFATKHYEKLRAMKSAGENVSAFIDRAIEHYDETFLPHQRGLDLFDVQEKVFRKNLSAVKRHIIATAPTGFENNAWRLQLRRWIALEEEE
jgi:hypothetical protein